MSHFSVAVISKDPHDVADLLAPYQKNNMLDCPREYLRFVDAEGKYKEEYETEYEDRIKDKNTGREYFKYDDKFWKVKELPEKNSPFPERQFILPNGCFEFKALYKDVYPTLQDFLRDYHGFELDAGEGKYGYWSNPNAKWDYWCIGGRWEGLIEATEGVPVGESLVKLTDGSSVKTVNCNYAQIKNIDFSMNEELYKKALRFWEVHVDDGEIAENEDLKGFEIFWNADYYRKRFKTKEIYAKESASLSSWAFLTPDGKWHEQCDDSLWRAINDENAESFETYTEAFKKALESVSSEFYITIVDCHV